MKFKYVEYHSREWELLSLQNVHDWGAVYGWITWEVLELDGIKIAKMVWTKF